MLDKTLKTIATLLTAATLSFALSAPAAAGDEHTPTDDIF